MKDKQVVAVHDDHSGNVHIYARSWNKDQPAEKLRQIVENFKWYFIINQDDYDAVKSCKRSQYILDMQPEGESWVRVYCENKNYNRYKREAGERDAKILILEELKELGIQTYEADLSTYQRYMIDHDVQMGQKFKIIYYDIETDDRTPGIEVGRDQIISFAAYDPISRKTYYKSTENERGLIKAMLKLFEEYDVMIGWNSEGFDLPYIRSRARKHGLEKYLYSLMGVQSMDLMKKFQETYGRDTDMVRKFRSFKLNDVANHFLGIGKIDRGSTWEMFTNDSKKLKEYNIRDVQLLSELEDKTGIVALSIIKANICGARLNEKTSGRVLDQYIIRAANKRGVHFKSVLRNVVEEAEDFTKGYIGGHVFTPKVGKHTNIHLFDFSSLYPSIIRTFNVSPETFRGTWNSGLVEEEGDGPFNRIAEAEALGSDIGTPTNVRYTGERGVIPSLIHDLVVIRNKMRKEEMPKLSPDSFEYKNLDKKQYVYKILANSMYGIIGAPFFRYYHHAMAESITRTGHFLTKEASRWCNERGWPTIYGDTDSIFIQVEDATKLKDIEAGLKDHFAKILKDTFNIRESFIVMDYKTSFDKFLIAAKKKYVGLQTDGEFELTGFEAVKRDPVKLGADAQMHLFDMIIKNDSDFDSVLTWLLQLKKKVMAGDVNPEQITIYKKLTKPPKDFVAYRKGGKLPAHAQIYLDTLNKLKDPLEVGSYIPFIITQGKPLVGVHPEFFDGDYDRVYYWNTRIYAILKRVLEVAYPEHDWEQYEELTEAQIKRKKKAEERAANPGKSKSRKGRTRRVKVVEEPKDATTKKALF
jgi:DNA polymerase elongation subunit (family B)